MTRSGEKEREGRCGRDVVLFRSRLGWAGPERKHITRYQPNQKEELAEREEMDLRGRSGMVVRVVRSSVVKRASNAWFSCTLALRAFFPSRSSRREAVVSRSVFVQWRLATGRSQSGRTKPLQRTRLEEGLSVASRRPDGRDLVGFRSVLNV